MEKVTLYHFTSRWLLPRILREGISRGDVPITPTEAFCAPWLTDDPSWEHQGWKKGSFLDKTEVRITVEVDASKLKTWEEVIEDYRVARYWAAAMIKSGERQEGQTWYIHEGTIPRDAFMSVRVRAGLEPLDATEIPPAFRYLKHRGTPSKPVETAWGEITRDAWIRETENWVRSPNMQYPWSDMPPALLRVLARADPRKAAKEGMAYLKKMGIDPASARGMDSRYEMFTDVDRTLPALLTMSGMGRWLSGPRRIIAISSPSAELLNAWEPRFQSLPVVQGGDGWKRGVMFSLKGSELSLMMYMEPVEGDTPGVRYVIWSQDEHKRWGTALDRVLQEALTTEEVMESGALATYTQFDHMLGVRSSLAITEEGVRLDQDKLRKIGINALAALHEDPRIVGGNRKAPRKNKRRKAGPVNRVKRLTLSFEGACLVTQRWAILPTKEQTEKIEHKPHSSPCLHTVDQHYWRVWVNTPKVHEKVLETRTKTRVHKGKTLTYTQYRVRRLRGPKEGYTRGNGVHPTRSRLVTGIDDLSPPGGE